MDSKSYLLLGGPEDGQIKPIHNQHPVYRVRTYLPSFNPNDPANTITAETHTYTRRALTGGEYVYAHTSIPSHEILPRLLRCYRPDPL